jgi:hypothetical protein
VLVDVEGPSAVCACQTVYCVCLCITRTQGYAPISIRLVEAALKGGWGPVAEVLSMMPGGQFDSLQVRGCCREQSCHPLLWWIASIVDDPHFRAYAFGSGRPSAYECIAGWLLSSPTTFAVVTHCCCHCRC